MARTPAKAHHLVDWDENERDVVGIVRCPEGDVATFQELATDLIAKRCPGYQLRPVAKWAWWKVDPVHPEWGCDFAWSLRQVDGPGRGRWQGALIYVDPAEQDKL